MPNTATEERIKRVPYHKKPDGMSIDKWQYELRKQFALDQNFVVENCGDHPFFSDFNVYNLEKESSYKVAIRSKEYGHNFCSCPDFTINALGTCKHIEYVLYYLKKNNKDNEYEGDEASLSYSSVSLRYEKERKLYLRIGTDNQEIMTELAKDYFDEDGYLTEDAFFNINKFIEEAEKIDPEFRVYPDASEYINNAVSAHKRKESIGNLFPKGVKSDYFRDLVKTDLYTYQKEGVIFGASAGRVLIADEMGLGKTVQTIAIAEILIKEFGVRNILIICPTSLKYQWKNEIEKFTDRSAEIVEGLVHKRKKQYFSDHTYKIIGYGVVKNDLDHINEFTPDLVILDEAQRIKNWKTKTAQAVKKISAEYAVVLTGTPLENKIEELHSIVEFIDRYKLGALFRFLYNHQIFGDGGKVIGYKKLNEINKSLSDILLRRTKKEIEDQLPERINKNYFVEMTDEQATEHNDYLEIVSKLVAKWRNKGFLSKEERERLLICLNCMRMVSDSTYILDQETRYDTKIDELVIILKEIFENGDDKTVVFSQWERMTRLVARELDKMKIRYEYLHGGVPAKKRKMLIENFHNDPESRVFLSTDAGGVGLNLQCANIVINIDLPWNPAVLEQRIGRVYRLGQKKNVRVINLVTLKSIEHRILHLLSFKKSVFAGVLDDGKDVVVMNETGLKSFMKSVEAMTEDSTEDGLYYTPHAIMDDEFSEDIEEYRDKRAGQKSSEERIFSPDKNSYFDTSYINKKDNIIGRIFSSKKSRGNTPNIITRIRKSFGVIIGLFNWKAKR